MKILVTTAGFGSKHELKSVWVPQKIEGVQVDFHRYNNDNYPSRVNSMHPRLKGKIFKMLPWEEFPDYDYYMWMDSTFQMVKTKAIEYALKSLGNADICFFKHPDRTTVRQEVDYVMNKLSWNDPYITSRYTGERIFEQYNEYCKDENYIDDLLLAACCFIYPRRLIENKDYNLMKEWFYHNCLWSIQDQISLPYLIKKFNINYNLFSNGMYDNPYLSFDMRIYSTQQ